jgi:hypothetical protein
MMFRGGCTMVVNGDTGEVRYTILKRIDSKARQALQRQYLSGQLGAAAASSYGALAPPVLGGEPFADLHRQAREEVSI